MVPAMIGGFFNGACSAVGEPFGQDSAKQDSTKKTLAKTNDVACNKIASLDASGKVSVNIPLGGSDSGKPSVSVEAKINDDNVSVSVEGTYDSASDTGNVNISVEGGTSDAPSGN